MTSDCPEHLQYAKSVYHLFSENLKPALENRKTTNRKRRELVDFIIEQAKKQEEGGEEEEEEEDEEEKSDDEKFIDTLVEYAEYERLNERGEELLKKLADEQNAEMDAFPWFTLACGVIGIDENRWGSMSKKVVEVMIECAKEIATKFGVSKLIKNNELDKTLQSQFFKRVLTEKVMTRIGVPGLEDVELEVAENLIDSYNRKPKEDRLCYSMKLVKHFRKVLEERNPLVTYRGGKIRLLKLDLQTCSVEKTASGDYVATDLDPKEIEKAEKKKEKNRKKKEKQKMKKKEEVKEDKEEEEKMPEVFKRCMDIINNVL
uniref:SPK domain-containing protein n=1 Tax=Caenorhabditis tropicalis TaxID=1561998 RepID=A0A1I7TUD5_9PELO